MEISPFCCGSSMNDDFIITWVKAIGQYTGITVRGHVNQRNKGEIYSEGEP